MAPEEYPKYHKTHCLAKPRWYNTIWYTFRPFKYPKGAQRDLICSQNSPFRPFEDPTMARKGKKRSQTLPHIYKDWLHWCDTFLLSFIPFWYSQEPFLGILGLLKPPKGHFWTFSPTGRFRMGCNWARWSGRSVATVWTPHTPMFWPKQHPTENGAPEKGIGGQKAPLGPW